MLSNIIIIGLIALTLLFALVKNGWRKCQYCTGFWICVLLTISFGFINGFELSLIVYPFAGGAITGIGNAILYK
jgi:hypothetical protein